MRSFLVLALVLMFSGTSIAQILDNQYLSSFPVGTEIKILKDIEVPPHKSYIELNNQCTLELRKESGNVRVLKAGRILKVTSNESNERDVFLMANVGVSSTFKHRFHTQDKNVLGITCERESEEKYHDDFESLVTIGWLKKKMKNVIEFSFPNGEEI